VKLSIDEFVELLFDSFEVFVEGRDLLGAQLEVSGLVAAAIERLQRHQNDWAVGFRGLASQLHVDAPVQRYQLFCLG